MTNVSANKLTNVLTIVLVKTKLLVMATDDLANDLRSRMAFVRSLSGISARELSTMMRVAHSAYSHVEAGRVMSPTAEFLTALASTTGVSLDWLLMGQGDPPSAEAIRAAIARARGHREQAATGTEG